MRGEKRKKIVVKKKQINYNSDSSSGDDSSFKNKGKLSAKDLHELDIEGKKKENHSSDEDEQELEFSFSDDDEKNSSKKKNDSLVEKNDKEIEEQKSLKLGSVISKILATKADQNVSKNRVYGINKI
jgi:hypothetical protein